MEVMHISSLNAYLAMMHEAGTLTTGLQRNPNLLWWEPHRMCSYRLIYPDSILRVNLCHSNHDWLQICRELYRLWHNSETTVTTTSSQQSSTDQLYWQQSNQRGYHTVKHRACIQKKYRSWSWTLPDTRSFLASPGYNFMTLGFHGHSVR